MNNKVKYIELVFKNLDICRMTSKMFKFFILTGIKDILNINCFPYCNGEWNRQKECEYFEITISKKGLNTQLRCDKTKLNNRLKQNLDIMFIGIIYEDDSKEKIYVPWNEENDYQNKYQKVNEYNNEITITIQKGNEDE